MPTCQTNWAPVASRLKSTAQVTVTKRSVQAQAPEYNTAIALASMCSILVYHFWDSVATSSSSVEVTMEHVFAMNQRASRRRTFRLFCTKLFTQLKTSPAVAVVALSYIQRLRNRNPGVQGGEGFEFRLFAVALMLAQKVLDDACMNVDDLLWSKASNIKSEELRIMEREFLLGLDFDLLVSPKQMSTLRGSVDRIIARYMLHLGNEEAMLCQAAMIAVKRDITACATTGDATGTCK